MVVCIVEHCTYSITIICDVFFCYAAKHAMCGCVFLSVHPFVSSAFVNHRSM